MDPPPLRPGFTYFISFSESTVITRFPSVPFWLGNELARRRGDKIESRGCRLQFLSIARIDFALSVAQLLAMSELAILYRRLRRPITPCESWLGRAARARGIAMMLSKADAAVVEAYAAECEAEAKRLIEEQSVPIAA